MRRRPAPAPALALAVGVALVVVLVSCADGGGRGADEDRSGPSFDAVRVDGDVVRIDTGGFRLDVGTDPFRLLATQDGEEVFREAEGGLHVVRDGTAVPVVRAGPTATIPTGVGFDVVFADGTDGTLDLEPLGPDGVSLALAPTDPTGVSRWGERLAHRPGEVVWGLSGPSPEGGLDRTGTTVTTDVAFHQTSAGYGLLVLGEAPVSYDVAASDGDVVEVQAPLPLDDPVARFVLLVAPTPADVASARARLGEPPPTPTQPAPAAGPATAEDVAAEALRLQQASFVGVAEGEALAGGGTPDDEVLVRSLQLAALAPTMVVAPPVDAARPEHRRFLDLHEALGPYLDRLGLEAAQHGVPVLRPLAFRYGDLREARTRGDQHLLGDDLLVAPVWQPGARERPVWFPPGRWVSFWDRDVVVEGPIELVVPAPLDEIPLYVRAGTELLELDPPG